VTYQIEIPTGEKVALQKRIISCWKFLFNDDDDNE